MGYDITLTEPVTGEVIVFDTPHNMRGGTYAVGGTTEAWISITYNYAPHFYKTIGAKGIREIYGMTGAESIPVLKSAIKKLKDDESKDYWEPTEGNAKKSLHSLLALATMRPDGIWRGD